MQCVYIEYKAPTLDNQQLPMYFYTQPYKILEDNANNVAVVFEGQSYWFDKKYILKSL